MTYYYYYVILSNKCDMKILSNKNKNKIKSCFLTQKQMSDY